MLSGKFYVAVAVAALPMLLFGFNTGVLNAPESVIFPTHSVWEWSVCVSAFCVGGLVGALSIGGLVHVYGRKPSLLLILVVNAFFGIFHVFTPNIYGLMVARLFVGVAGGAATVVTPLYLAELAPPETKGSIGTLTQLSCVMGILASVLWALPFLSETEWRWIFIPLPLVSGLGILIAVAGGLPESPKWLLLHHPLERGREARNILASFRSAMDDDQIELQVLLTLQGSTMTTTTTTNATATITHDEDEEENEPITRVTNTSPSATSTSHRSFSDYLADPKSRIPVLSSVLFPIAQQLSGINAVFYYSTLFFDDVLEDPKMGTIYAFSVNVLATVVALLLMDKLGRKTLLSVSAGGMLVCCLLLTMGLLGKLPPKITFASVMVYISCFELGLGCIPFFLASELVPAEFSARVQSIAMGSNWACNFLVGLFFPLMDKQLGAYSFLPFAVVLLVTALYALCVLPETRGKPLHQFLEELEQQRRRGSSQLPLAQEEDAGNGPESELV